MCSMTENWMATVSEQPVTQEPAAAPESVLLGARLREFRHARRMSLRGLATAAGVSAGHLSEIEHGTANVSVGSLRKLTDVLGLTIADLFDPEAATGHRLIHGEDRPQISMAHGVRKYLISQRPLQHLEIYSGEFDPGAYTSESAYTHGDSQEIVVVIRGFLTAELDGEPVELRPGSSLEFRSSTPHRLVNGPEPAEVLWIISPPTSPSESLPTPCTPLRATPHHQGDTP